ncbi:hypothetical protein AVEN_175119-1 [Araneus ventricosus]|uniref:Histone-lysine N-methyltransferase SETMAR n=1 Tax=Araneus ventricosus TaxID=182803 RepID=A0A4Y2N059_ARAVE|nr:hypothetical protein AVEN_175119-1 [Araneus ventricosus]
MATVTRNLKQRLGWNVLEHPPYSPDIAQNAFHPFGRMKKNLACRHFRTETEVQIAVVVWHRELDPYSFYVYGLVYRCHKCFNNHGDYVEK